MNLYKDNRVLIIGGSGFIGSNLAIKLAGMDCSVTILDQAESYRSQFLPKSIELIFEPNIKQERLNEIFNQNDLVFNFASIKKNKSYHSKHPAEIIRANSIINFQVLDALINSSAEKLILMSTSVVDSMNKDCFDVNMVSGHFGYAWSKKITEISALAYAKQYDKSIYIVRSDSVFGELDDFESFPQIIPSLISKISNQDSIITLFGDGKQTRNFLYVKDLLDGLLDLIEEGPRNEVIEFFGDREITIKETAEAIIKIFDSDARLVFEGSDNDISLPKNEKISASKKINFKPNIEFNDALKNTINWYMNEYKKNK